MTAHTLLSKRGNNPYCHHRVLTLAEQGKRERIVQRGLSLKRSFDYAQHELIEEPLDAAWPDGDPLRFCADQVEWPGGIEAWPLAH